MLHKLNMGLNLDLKSGHPVLEFTNTVSNHASEHPGEKLFNYEDLLAWTGKVGLLHEEQLQMLMGKAATQPKESAAIFAKSLELRETVYRIFVAKTKAKSPADRDLMILNSVLAPLTSDAQIVYRSGGFEWGWNFDESALEAPLWVIVL